MPRKKKSATELALRRKIQLRENWHESHARKAYVHYRGECLSRGVGESELYEWLQRAEAIATKLLATEFSRNEVQYRQASRNDGDLGKLRRTLRSVVRTQPIIHIENHRLHEFSPKVMLILDAIKILESSIAVKLTDGWGNNDHYFGENSAILAILNRRKSRAFEKASKAHTHRRCENLKSLCKYWDDLLSIYPTMLVVRVELYYPQARESLSNAVLAQRGFNKLVRSLREAKVTESPMIGHAVNREHGPARGMQYRLMAAFDGDAASGAADSATAICEEWVSRFGMSSDSRIANASYFSPYNQVGLGNFNGIGRINASDKVDRLELRIALESMCQDRIRYLPSSSLAIANINYYEMLKELGVKNLRKGLLRNRSKVIT